MALRSTLTARQVATRLNRAFLPSVKKGTIGGAKNVVTGDREVDKKLHELEPKLQKKFARQATRRAVREVVLPEALARVPVDTGQLESSLTARATKRSREFVGAQVVTREGFFSGETYYGGMVEFGTKNMEADPYLRPALYGNESRIREFFIRDIKELIREA